MSWVQVPSPAFENPLEQRRKSLFFYALAKRWGGATPAELRARKRRINLKLEAHGWHVSAPHSLCNLTSEALTEFEMANGPAGYVFICVCAIQRMAVGLFGWGAIFAIGEEEIDGILTVLPAGD